jgi:hypothetical protein
MSPPALPAWLARVRLLNVSGWKPKKCQLGLPGLQTQLARLSFWLTLRVAGGASGHPKCQPKRQPSELSTPARPTSSAVARLEAEAMPTMGYLTSSVHHPSRHCFGSHSTAGENRASASRASRVGELNLLGCPFGWHFGWPDEFPDIQSASQKGNLTN